MKLTLSVLALLALASLSNAYVLPSLGDGELANELQEFLDVLPLDEIADLTKRYLARDREFQLVMDVVQCDDVKRFIGDVGAMPEFTKFVQYLHRNGIQVYTLLNYLNETITMEPVKVDTVSNCKITGGFYGYTKDLDEILPWQYISNLFEYKVEMSTVFNEFVNECFSPEYTKLFTTTFTNENFLNAMQQLDALKIDSETFRANFTNLFLIRALLRQYV